MKTTSAFILSHLKYGDSSIIVKCYTEKFGFKSFIIKGAFSKKNKKHPYIFSLNEVVLTFKEKKNNSLELISTLQQGVILDSLHQDIYKSSMISFITEVLNQVLKSEVIENTELYNFIKANLIQLDIKQENFLDFHLYFLLELSKHIGFYPLDEKKNLPYFNIQNGCFCENKISTEQNGELWKSILEYTFEQGENCFNNRDRKQMIEELISYYETHLSEFKKPLSLEVLKMVFS